MAKKPPKKKRPAAPKPVKAHAFPLTTREMNQISRRFDRDA